MSAPARPGWRRGVAVAAFATLSLGLSGCGLFGGDDSPTSARTSGTSTSAPTGGSTTSASTTTTPAGVSVAELFRAARTTAEAAKSARVRGTVTNDGDQVRLDLSGTTDGTNQKLQLTTPDGTVTVITVAGKYYLVADKAYWEKNAGETAAEQLAGKYVLMSEEDASSFGAFTIGALLDELFGNTELSPLDQIRTTVTATTQDKQQVYVLSDRLSDTGKVVVSADGKAQLRSIQVGGANPGSLTFSDWNAVQPLKAPAAGDVVKL